MCVFIEESVMIVKQKLLSLLVAGFAVLTGQAMDFDEFSQKPCKTCDQVPLNDFWTKAKNGEFDQQTIEKHLRSELRKNGDKSYEECSNILHQALCSGKIDHSYQPFFGYSKHYPYETDLVGLAIEKEDLELLDICLEQGYSPNNPITIDKEKKSILEAINSRFRFYYKKNPNLCLQVWSRLKKHNADFNIPINKQEETLLHDFIHGSYLPQEALLGQWLLNNTNIDINRPDVYGNTAGHRIADYCGMPSYTYEISEAAFNVLKQNNFNPLQRNNYGQTTRDMIRSYAEKDEKIITLWKEYETEYKLNNPDYATNQKCYNQKNSINLTITPQEAYNAYDFFPKNAKIRTFCKRNFLDHDCLQLAELFIAANEAYHAGEYKENIRKSDRSYSEEKNALKEKIYSIKDNVNITKKICDKALTDKELNLLDLETKEQLANIEQLNFEERFFLVTKIRNVLTNLPLLENLLTNVEQKCQIASEEYTKVNIKEQENLKRIKGNYQPLCFDNCQDSWYHKSVKKLLKKVITNPFYTKQLHQGKEIDVLTPEVEEECLKISEALYNARCNQKQE